MRMWHRSSVNRSVIAGLLLCASLSLSTAPGRADTDSCIAQYDQAVAANKKGELIAARSAYAACAVEACPAEVREECERASQRVAGQIPTIVVAARTASGSDVSQGDVFVDGQRVPRALDGLPIEIDPGRHEIELRLPDGTGKRISVVARTNQKGRLIRLDLDAPAPEAPPPAADSGGSVLAPVLIGVGGVALASFGVFAALGYAKQNDLEDGCKPACAPDEISEMQRYYLIADISLVVSALAFGSGIAIMISGQPGDSASVALSARF